MSDTRTCGPLLQAATPEPDPAAVAFMAVEQAQAKAAWPDCAEGASKADHDVCLEAMVVVCCKQSESPPLETLITVYTILASDGVYQDVLCNQAGGIHVGYSRPQQASEHIWHPLYGVQYVRLTS